ncbi:MAG: F0F1 ATP synthase subunit B [Patescibacteria group bacterium]
MAAEELHAATEAVEATGGIGALGLNAKIFIAQLINFTIVLLVLWKWAYKPIMRLLEERQVKIEKSVKDAEEIEKRVTSLAGEREEVLKAAKAEAQAVVDEAMATADVRKAEMIDKAKREVERVIVQGKAQLNAEREAMVREARKDLVEVALAATKRIIGEEMNEKKAASLAEEVVRKMT